MGQLVEKLALQAGDEVTAIVSELDTDLAAGELAEKLKGADVAIDFSAASAARRNIEACCIAGIPVVEGTTGWNAELETIKQLVAEKNGALVFGANFSVGVNVFYRVVSVASELFAQFSEYEPFIEEQHHSRKKDAPSGTALKLKSLVEDKIKRDFTVSSTRAGNIPGTHTVGFDGTADQITLTHTARSREGFASGALVAAKWSVKKWDKGQRGVWEFTEVMDEILR